MRVQNQVLTHGSFVLSTMRGAVGLALCLLVFSSAAFGQSVWNGNTGFWNNAGNWIGGVPTSSGLALIDDGNTAVASSVTVNTTNAQAYGVFLDSGDTLTLTGFPDTQANLTVNAASLSGTMNIGGGASFTVNGTANQLGGTVSLSTAQLGGGLAPLMGQINGGGTYDNQAGLIIGAGLVSTPLSNEGTVAASGNLYLTGNVTNTGTMNSGNGGNLIINNMVNDGNVSAANGGTLTINGFVTSSASSSHSGQISVGNGGTMVVNGGLSDYGFANVASGGTVILNGNPADGGFAGGVGFVFNEGTIEGAGNLVDVTAFTGSLISANKGSSVLYVEGLTTAGGQAPSTLEALNGGIMSLEGEGALPGTNSAGLVQVDVGSEVIASGTLNTSDHVLNGGTFFAFGVFQLNGNYIQVPDADLDMRLGTSPFSSQMNVDGMVSFGTGSVLDVFLEDSSFFNPEAGCTNVFGVCDSWDVLRVTDGKILDGGNLIFDLPSLPDGLTWSEIETPNDITLDIDGVLPTTGGGGGGSGTTTPEPGTLLLLAGGLVGLVCLEWRKRPEGVRSEGVSLGR
jgi:hypothetical protein